MEFHPKESLRAVQKDSQLLFPHYFPCTGNETPHVQTHTQTSSLLVCADSSSSIRRRRVKRDLRSPGPKILVPVCACAQWLIYLRRGRFACVLKRYTHTLNNINVFTLSPRCEAFTAHQSDFAKDGFGFENFSAPCDLSGAVQWSQSNRVDSRESLSFTHSPPPLMLKRLKLLTTDTRIFVILTLWAWHFVRRPLWPLLSVVYFPQNVFI